LIQDRGLRIEQPKHREVASPQKKLNPQSSILNPES